MPLVLWTTLLRLANFWNSSAPDGYTEDVVGGILAGVETREPVPVPLYKDGYLQIPVRFRDYAAYLFDR